MLNFFRICLRKLLSRILPRRLGARPGEMTIPSRPAPAPPGARAQSAADGANASLDQLRLQLQQQHLQQQQSSGGSLQKLTIKLPPPPKGPLQQQSLNAQHKRSNNNLFEEQTASSITRKFPQARYTPTTNWDDDPFGGGGGGAAANGNGNFRKMPPPRPPPPKVQVQMNGHKVAATGTTATSAGGGGNLISNIFHRKKNPSTATSAASKAAVQSRVYGLSSGHAGTAAPTAAAAAAASSGSGSFSNMDWNAAWNTATTTTTTTDSSISSSSAHYSHTTSNGTAVEGQLISFDSPPSSPTFTQKSNSDCVSVDSFSSDSNFSSPNNGSVSQPESGFEDDFHRSRPATQSPLDPWEAVDSAGHSTVDSFGSAAVRQTYQTYHQIRTSDNPLCNGKSLLPPTQSLAMPTIIKPKISQKPKAPRAPPFVGGMPPGYVGAFNPPSPPMPKGAPPPLPPSVGSGASGISMLDVIAGRVDAMALSNGSSGYIEQELDPYAIALYDFNGVEEGDLSFRENEKIYLLEQPTPEWIRGRTRSGCEGIFPATYVDIKVPLGAGQSQSQSHPQPPATLPPQQQHKRQQQQQQHEHTALCLYHFPGEVEGDLPLQENELVTVLYRINEEWLFGEAGGRQGQFPANFLEQVPAKLPTL